MPKVKYSKTNSQNINDNIDNYHSLKLCTYTTLRETVLQNIIMNKSVNYDDEVSSHRHTKQNS